MATEQLAVQLTKLLLSFRNLAPGGFPSGHSKRTCACVRLHSEISEPNMLISRTRHDEHPPTAPSCQWPALITLPTLAKFQLVWRRLCDVALFRCSGLFEDTLMAVCALPEYQSRRKCMCIETFFKI